MPTLFAWRWLFLNDSELSDYVDLARGQPASRRISPPPRCLPRAPFGGMAVEVMADALNARRLSGAWIGLHEALAWARTRDFSLSRSLANSSGSAFSLSLAKWHIFEAAEFALTREDAENGLLEALRHGDVRSIATEAVFPPRPIESASWARLRFDGSIPAARPIDGANGASLHDLLFDSSDVLRVFPMLGMDEEEGAAPADAKSKATDQPGAGLLPRSVKTIVKSILKEWADGGSMPTNRPTQDLVLARVKSERPNESRASVFQAFKAEQANYPETDWTKRGPKPLT